MLKYIEVLLTICVTSLYFFPFQFTFLPSLNTKMILAGFSLVLLAVNMAKSRSAAISRDFFTLSVLAAVVSLVGYAAVVVNGTSDYTYASYIVSMWVWLGGAYFVTQVIKVVHGDVSVKLICDYLIAVCLLQCMIAFAMEQYLPLKNFVDSFLASEGFMGKVEGRLYGIGASLDVGGMRFGAILAMIAYWSTNSHKEINKLNMLFYVVSFLVILFVGNMIGRTTIVGGLVAVLYVAINLIVSGKGFSGSNVTKLKSLLLPVLVVFIPLSFYLYTQTPFRENIRFAFEGFFSLAETGRWETNSTNILSDMFVFPDNLKTWLIGDGYFDSPYDTDPYYTGRNYPGFYMDTDVGYCRFLFYFGILGTIAFICFMFRAALSCIRRFPKDNNIFIMILLMNYIVWFKVASDLFLIFALFLCISVSDTEVKTELCT